MSNLSANSTPANRPRVSTRKLTAMGLMAAVSVMLVAVVHFPIFPAAPFLEYDPADISIFICTFLYGPVSGLLLTLVVSVIQGLTVSAASGPIGIIMHIFATGTFVLVSGNIYRDGVGRRRGCMGAGHVRLEPDLYPHLYGHPPCRGDGDPAAGDCSL